MKRFTLVVAAMFAVSLSFGAISCDKYDDGRPDKSVRNEFSQMYPDARDVEWEAEAGYWKVSFETGKAPDRIDHEAWYAEDGTWVRTVSEYPISPSRIMRWSISKLHLTESSTDSISGRTDVRSRWMFMRAEK